MLGTEGSSGASNPTLREFALNCFVTPEEPFFLRWGWKHNGSKTPRIPPGGVKAQRAVETVLWVLLFPRKGKCRQYVETTVSVPKPALIRNVLFGLVKYGGLGLRDWLFY